MLENSGIVKKIKKNDEQGSVAPGSIQRWQYIATINVNFTYYRFGLESDFPRKIYSINTLGNVIFPLFKRFYVNVQIHVVRWTLPFCEHCSKARQHLRNSVAGIVFREQLSFMRHPAWYQGCYML